MKHASLLTISVLSATMLSGCFESSSLTSGPSTDTSGYLPRLPDTLPVGIDEICASNDALLDEFGDDPGWIELANRSTDSVHLRGYRLRGRAADGPGWMLPDTVLPPGGRLMVFMSGRDIDTIAPPGDSLRAGGSTWSWSDSLATPAGGYSAVRGLLFGKRLSGKLADGTTAYSFFYHLADNTESGLEWSGASAGVSFTNQVDASGRDRFWMRATIPAGQPLSMRLCDDEECWKEGAVTITGTGDSLGVYELPLSKFGIDISGINGIQFDPPSNRLGDYKITFKDIRFFRSPRRPHANFSLQRKGGSLVLEDTASRRTVVVDYPAATDGGSWFRDGTTGNWGRSNAGTPGATNPVITTPTILVAPVFATTPGFQTGPLTVRVAGPGSSVVRCAKGGFLPTATSPAADTGVRVDSSTSLTCAVFDSNGGHGPYATATYLVGEPSTIPVVTVSVDPNSMFDPDTGICSLGPNAAASEPFYGANFWHETELPIHVELFESGSRSFALRAGMAIYGNWSRSAEKKAFTIQMREKYGPTHVEWPLFPQHPNLRKFKGFGLRANGSNYQTDYQRDALASSLTEGRGIEYQLARHVALYLNGKYWGIYEIREKLDADYLETRFGIDPSNVDLIKNNSETQAGSIADWNAVRQTLQSLQADDSAGWEAISKRIDLDNFMDYYAAELFAQNNDWPANNNRYWRQRAPASRWRAMLFDLDAGLGSFGGTVSKNPFPFAVDSSLGWDDYPNGPGSNVVLRRILTRPALRNRFLNRFLVQLATNLSAQNSARVMDSVTASIQAEIPKDVARWELDADRLASQDKVIHNFLLKRPDVLRGHMKTFFKLDSLQNVSLSATGGTLLVEGMNVGSFYAGQHFRSIPVTLEAVGASGSVFTGWSDGISTSRRILTPGESPVSLVANFR